MSALREQAQQELRVYMGRTQLTMRELGQRIGFSEHSLRQFNSIARYGDGDGSQTAQKILEWIKEHPGELPDLPGKLYETSATRQIDGILEHVKNGGWGVLYGPSGAQKTFFLEYRSAESAREPEPRIVYIRSSAAGMTAGVLLRRIASGIGAPYSQYTEGIRQSILSTIRKRRKSLALVIDEADALYRFVETLETLREIGDLARSRPGRAGVGILMAGNERVMGIFKDRPGIYFEKWRGRIEQQETRVLGPSEEEALRILTAEIGLVSVERARRAVEKCAVKDPISGQSYVNMHRLFNAIRDVGLKRGAQLGSS